MPLDFNTRLYKVHFKPRAFARSWSYLHQSSRIAKHRSLQPAVESRASPHYIDTVINVCGCRRLKVTWNVLALQMAASTSDQRRALVDGMAALQLLPSSGSHMRGRDLPQVRVHTRRELQPRSLRRVSGHMRWRRLLRWASPLRRRWMARGRGRKRRGNGKNKHDKWKWPPGLMIIAPFLETDGRNGLRRRSRRCAEKETRRWGFVWAAVFCRHLYVHNVAVHNIIVIFFLFYYSITLFHREAVRGTLLYERAIKVVLKVKLKPFLKKLLTCFVCPSTLSLVVENFFFHN